MVEQRRNIRVNNAHLRRIQINHAVINPLVDTNEDRDQGDMELLDNLEVSDKEDCEEQVPEEDYDPKTLEEMKERAEPQFYDEADIPEFTCAQSNATADCKPSRMYADAVNAQLEPGAEAVPDYSLLMSEEVEEKSYAYGHVGVRMQKRIPLK